jgi:hypothetical protein
MTAESLQMSKLTSIMVPGVPMMTCCVNLGMPLVHESFPAKKHSTGVYSPMRWTTWRICIASSRDGAIQMAWEDTEGQSLGRGRACTATHLRGLQVHVYPRQHGQRERRRFARSRLRLSDHVPRPVVASQFRGCHFWGNLSFGSTNGFCKSSGSAFSWILDGFW